MNDWDKHKTGVQALQDCVALRRRWVNVSDLTLMLRQEHRYSRPGAYRFLRYWMAANGARRTCLVRYVWWTLASNPAYAVDWCAFKEWISVPKRWRDKHSIAGIVEQDDYNHAMLLGALAYSGDDAAMNSFEALRRRYQQPEYKDEETVRGLGCAMDIYLYGEEGARRMSDD